MVATSGRRQSLKLIPGPQWDEVISTELMKHSDSTCHIPLRVYFEPELTSSTLSIAEIDELTTLVL